MNLAELTTEGRNPASDSLDRLSALEIVRLMNEEDRGVPQAVASIAEAITKAIDVIADRLGRGGRLIYLGAGTSGRLGVLDAAECPPTFNSPPWQVVGLIAGGAAALTRAVEGAEDHAEFAVEDLNHLEVGNCDVVVGIATSGRTPYVIGGLEQARSLGAYTIGLTCNEDAAVSRAADLTLAPVVGPEIISGSTRLKAGTATKLVLNMLSTGAMVKLGKVYGNLMVDLQATNKKLTDRSARIVSALTGLPRDQSDDLLKRCDGDVKLSFLVHQRGLSLAAARHVLEQARGRLREALNQEVVVPRGEPIVTGLSFVLGVDGGGSKTVAWLVDTSSETNAPRGIGRSGPSNPLTAGWHAALANIDLAIARAFIAAGISRQPVAAACLSIAGTGRDIERQRLQLWAEHRRIAERNITTHDAYAVLTAGTSAGIGAAVISGTGSFAFGRDETGRTARAGGWGPLLGDEGSGEAIARAALHAVTRAHDGIGPATLLTDALLPAIKVATAIDLREAVSQESPGTRRLPALAPLVIAAAEDGDHVALQIIEDAARALAQLVVATHRQLVGERLNTEFELAVAGGVLVHAELLRQRMLAALSDAGLCISRIGLVDEPVRGCIRLAQAVAHP